MFRGSAIKLGTALCCLLSIASIELVQAGEVAWRRNPHAAQQETRQSGRPLLIYVGADFCGYCRKLEGTTWADDVVSRTIDVGFVPLHVDGQRDADLTRRLGVRGFPAVIVLSAEGQITGRVDGYRNPAEMQAFLVRHGVFRERTSE